MREAARAALIFPVTRFRSIYGVRRRATRSSRQEEQNQRNYRAGDVTQGRRNERLRFRRTDERFTEREFQSDFCHNEYQHARTQPSPPTRFAETA